MPRLLKLVDIPGYNTDKYICERETAIVCEKMYCICSPDINSKFPHKCPGVGHGKPDCYLVILKNPITQGSRRESRSHSEAILVECRCDLEQSGNRMREIHKMIREDIIPKFQNSSNFPHTRKILVIPRGGPRKIDIPPNIEIERCGSNCSGDDCLCIVCRQCS